MYSTDQLRRARVFLGIHSAVHHLGHGTVEGVYEAAVVTQVVADDGCELPEDNQKSIHIFLRCAATVH